MENILRVSAGVARSTLSDLIGRVGYGQERIVITKSGRDAIAMVPISDLKKLEELEAVREAHAGRSKKKKEATLAQLLST